MFSFAGSVSPPCKNKGRYCFLDDAGTSPGSRAERAEPGHLNFGSSEQHPLLVLVLVKFKVTSRARARARADIWLLVLGSLRKVVCSARTRLGSCSCSCSYSCTSRAQSPVIFLCRTIVVVFPSLTSNWVLFIQLSRDGGSRDADHSVVRPAKARVYSFNSLSLSMEDLATLTTALSVPRNPWFIHSTLPRWRISRR